jgi:ABC-type Na+ efflux pump permease subunit
MKPVPLAFDIGEQFKLKGNVGIGSQTSPYQTVGGFISLILPNVYIAASLILFILLIAGGFAIMSSGSDPQKKAKGAKAVTSAVVGFIIIFTSFWLIKLIEFLTGINIFKAGV